MLPAPTTLERLIGSVAAHTVQDLSERIAAALREQLCDTIGDFVDVSEGEHRSPTSRSHPQRGRRDLGASRTDGSPPRA